MKNFTYAAPRSESRVLELLSAEPGETEILAGGTDLVGLMKQMLVTPERVVNIKEVASLRGIDADSTGVTIGAVTTLDELLDSHDLNDYTALKQAIAAINSPQLQAQGTIGGDLCQRPRCWYYRNGYGLLRSAKLVEQGENRFHAIFGNSGPAKFVCASRLAPPLIALGARVRIAGPGAEDELVIPLEAFFRTPRSEGEREHMLAPNQLLAQIMLPPAGETRSATYEIAHGAGPDYPLASASVALELERGIVRQAVIVLGQVAPVPWYSSSAAKAIVGLPVTEETARLAGEAGVAYATPLSDNGYKVQLAKIAIERALRRAVGLPTGGFE